MGAAIEGILAASIEREGLRGASVCVALSGGVDSVVLLHALATLASEFSVELSAIHVNHGLSPNAFRWEKHCRELCRSLRVALAVKRVKVPPRRKQGLEAAAREARYAVLGTAKTKVVALAHQLDDQAETVVLNLLRGAGLRGAAAMAESGPLPVAHDPDAPLAWRPLLPVPRESIVEYALSNRLHWDEDESNADEALSRNWVRRSLGPVLVGRYPRWRESLARAAQHFGEAEQLLAAGVSERLTTDALRAAPAAKARLLLREFLRSGGARAPDARRLGEMLRQVLDAPEGARVELVHDGKVLRRFRNELAVVPVGAVQGEVVFHACKGAGIDAAKFRMQPMTVRVREGGERLRLAPNRPSRTLKNLFQEAGVPPWERDRMPLLFSGEDLVWVPALGIAAEYRARKGGAGLLPEWRRSP